MARRQAQFVVEEAGCLIYVADRSLLAGTAGQGPVTGGELYQDDGFYVRVVFGELTGDEQSNWTSRLASNVHLPSGQMIVSGILDPDYDRWLEDFGTAEITETETAGTSGEFELGCVIEIEPGEYAVEILGYPPNDLAAGWMEIEESESATEYFKATRPGEPVPEWVSEGWEDADFLDFVIRLERVGDADADAATAAGQRYPEWEFRRPDVCPVGIRL